MTENSSPPARPIPAPGEISQPFWDAAADGRLAMQVCDECSAYVWTPRAICYECGSRALTWQTLSGRGEVFSFTVIRQVAGRGTSAYFAGEIPYAVALIELTEGPRMLATLAGCDVDAVEIGMKVRVRFDQVSPEIHLPSFEPLV
ncbi:MAG TPA: Zn-ribbon domain-containing OB-fold protein [Dehalococcoidia bacterium]|nr:Zn-ribbon domain-containing OB-fold protein [Dehalococcoidia bacterium]